MVSAAGTSATSSAGVSIFTANTYSSTITFEYYVYPQTQEKFISFIAFVGSLNNFFLVQPVIQHQHLWEIMLGLLGVYTKMKNFAVCKGTILLLKVVFFLVENSFSFR
jgi:hypothetical protein